MIRSIYWKMLAGFGLIILTLVMINGYVLVQLQTVRNTVRSLVDTEVHVIGLMRSLHGALADEEQSAQKFLITGDTVYASLLRENANVTTEIVDSLVALRQDRHSWSLLRHIRRGHEAVFALVTDSLRTANRLSDEAIADSMAALGALVDGWLRQTEDGMHQALGSVEVTTDRSLNAALILGGVSLVAMVIAVLAIARSITRPLRILQKGTEQVARGDFAPIPVVTHDEIGRLAEAFNAMSNQLKKVDELKAEMLHHISHELRVPLQSVMAAYYLLTEGHRGPLNAEQEKLLGLIRDNIDRIVAFSNQFLDLAKIEAGAMEFRREVIDVAEVLQPLMDNMRLLAARRNVRMSLDVQQVPRILGDSEKIGQVFTNLISNAVKYTPPGGAVNVGIGRTTNGVRFAVKDNGIGIHPDDLPHIFEKFYQARNATGSDGKGSGVGLALVKAIVDGHAGRVSANSSPGAGSTFTVDFPAAARMELDDSLKSREVRS